jgi:hypothetical protein
MHYERPAIEDRVELAALLFGQISPLPDDAE